MTENRKHLNQMKAQSKRLLAQLLGTEHVLAEAHPICRFVESMVDTAVLAASADRAQDVVEIKGLNAVNINLGKLVQQEEYHTLRKGLDTVASEKHGNFMALGQFAVNDGSIEAYHVNLLHQGDSMVLALPEGAVYINKAQAMAFFDLEEKGAQKPPSNEVAGGLKLNWSEPAAPNKECWYDHIIAETPFGRFLLTWKSWKGLGYGGLGFDETPWGDTANLAFETLEEAKSWASAELARRIAFSFSTQ